jgi:hypothetical protein
MNQPVKVRVCIELETHGDREAEELTWLLNLFREEMVKSRWVGKIRRVEMPLPQRERNLATAPLPAKVV